MPREKPIDVTRGWIRAEPIPKSTLIIFSINEDIKILQEENDLLQEMVDDLRSLSLEHYANKMFGIILDVERITSIFDRIGDAIRRKRKGD